MQIKSTKIKIYKTGSYSIFGDPSEKISSVWFVLHGYGQLANEFIKYFKPVVNKSTIVVAPEALNKYYLKGFSGKIGATWMTRENREDEISDYVNYLNSVYEEVIKNGLFKDAGITVLGFSQGTSTAVRWITGGVVNPDRLILWGGGIPHDVDLGSAKSVLDKLKLSIVIGDKDQFITEEQIAVEEKRLNENKINYQIHRFSGGHEIKADVLKESF